jgi:hypothetical protein
MRKIQNGTISKTERICLPSVFAPSSERFGATWRILEDIRQLVRAFGSVAANYIEANEALSRKDFVMRIKICRKSRRKAGFFFD